ncbi:putative membrane protein [Pseudooceanicola batsensis HTCC2597]|uniref:TRAP transporter small permease protein n=1 Tax=Pseudooceanicola batsensis (strain ATCC BAA-863 / DSM 15984 / KCTC 12145 / HTCC2597) TaxID=252305 RepID=A3U0J3_PSEBH|nr:TRAP transporter small permease [Pseudooceanicola batsensis]EAQ02284.1 putative membrane protein [Pseudooceanicola batsensis HTCC2597]
MKRLENLFVALNGWALILMLSAMALIVGYNISLRYLTSHSLPWADEAARYLMIWLTFSGAGLILRVGGHVAITNLQDVLPRTGHRLLRAAIVVILLIFFGFMVHVGWQYAQRMQYQVTPALRLPFLYVYAAMPVGFTLLILHLLLIARPFILAGTYKPLGTADTDDNTLPGGADG